MSLRKAIRMTKVNLSELVKGSDEDRQVLETRHIELEGSRRLAVEAERASALAASKGDQFALGGWKPSESPACPPRFGSTMARLYRILYVFAMATTCPS